MNRMFSLPAILVLLFSNGRAGGQEVSGSTANAAGIYRRAASAVATVYGEAGHGSGFLVDPSGLILTNAHVIQGSGEVRVQWADTLNLRAKVIYVDSREDVAVLQARPPECSTCRPLLLAGQTHAVTVGEPVFTIGSPLNLRRVVTSGIIAGTVEDGLLLDVAIAPGNSGGPVLDARGEVVGMVTFADQTGRGDRSLGGAIGLRALHKALNRSLPNRLGIHELDAERLPVASEVPFPLEIVQRAARRERWPADRYAQAVDDFEVLFMTPPLAAWRRAALLREYLKKRQAREVAGELSALERFDPIQHWPLWDRYLGAREPLVIVNVVPNTRSTGASLFLNLAGGIVAGMTDTYWQPFTELEFASDFRRLRLTRNGETVTPVSIGRVPAVLNADGYRVFGQDLAYQGVYAYRPDVFAPTEGGAQPLLEMWIYEASGDSIRAPVRFAPQEEIWRDFAAHRVAEDLGGLGDDLTPAELIQAVERYRAADRVHEAWITASVAAARYPEYDAVLRTLCQVAPAALEALHSSEKPDVADIFLSAATQLAGSVPYGRTRLEWRREALRAANEYATVRTLTQHLRSMEYWLEDTRLEGTEEAQGVLRARFVNDDLGERTQARIQVRFLDREGAVIESVESSVPVPAEGEVEEVALPAPRGAVSFTAHVIVLRN